MSKILTRITTSIFLLLLASFVLVNTQEVKQEGKLPSLDQKNQCLAPYPLHNLVFPWRLGHWPAVNVFWNYEMTAQIVEFHKSKNLGYTLHLKVDSENNRARQDYYKGVGDIKDQMPIQSVIGDYKYAMIMDIDYNEQTKASKCNITRFDESLDTIRNIISEMWFPRADSYTTAFGLQCVLQTNGSYYGFKTISSDEQFWNVFFRESDGMPEFAINDGPNITQVVFKKGAYIPRTDFRKEEFYPKECEESTNLFTIEGPIIPLADFAFLM